MLFNSAEYIFLFLPVAVLGYFFLNDRDRHKEAKLWLVFASLFFYGYWNYRYIALLVISLLVNYRTAYHAEGNKKLLVFGVLFNLALLFYFKYCDFFIENVNQLAGMSLHLMNVVLPLGISFITFQKIAYLVDSYKGKVKNRSFIDFSLFATFFPQLIAGPIVHHAEIIPQFNEQKKSLFSWKNIAVGTAIFMIGLFKKVVIADYFYWIVFAGHDIKNNYSFFAAWALSLFYTIQIYFDFSGYTDMAIGAALLMNIKLPQNFHSPYKARNITDFWRRWHMTLSRWLRDYLYIPLGGNRAGEARVALNLMVTFVIGGVWHGANWTFVIWGVLHGASVIFYKIWCKLRIEAPSFIAIPVTFFLVNFLWVFFRAESVSSAVSILRGMADVSSAGRYEDLVFMIDSGIGSTWLSFLQGKEGCGLFITVFFAITLIAFCFSAKNTNEIINDFMCSDRGFTRGFVFSLSLVIALAAFFMLYAYAKPSPFIYFQF